MSENHQGEEEVHAEVLNNKEEVVVEPFACDEFKEGEKLSLRLSANVKDTVLNKNAHTWQFVSDGNTSVLIAPYRGKAVDIPEEYKNPDYLIINNAVEGMEGIEYGEALWTSDKKPPTSLKNVTCVINGDYTIDF